MEFFCQFQNLTKSTKKNSKNDQKKGRKSKMSTKLKKNDFRPFFGHFSIFIFTFFAHVIISLNFQFS